MIALRQKTDPAWIPLALAHFDAVLVDHAHCEKKAAAHALSLLSTYSELPGLPKAMANLAREEARHLGQVVQLLEKRGLKLGRDPGDPYAKGLYALARSGGNAASASEAIVCFCASEKSCFLPQPASTSASAISARRRKGAIAVKARC